jgi:hypothetical protein
LGRIGIREVQEKPQEKVEEEKRGNKKQLLNE